jgi:CubicO group peptidase (beta-lactamase class C family)
VQHLDVLLRRATQDGTIPGAVIYVGYQGQTMWQQAYGAAALVPTWRPMQCDTVFDIASLTKVVATTSLALWAHHAGVCRLDDCLQRFYPVLTHSRLGAVTLRQLLAHGGGLAAWQPLYQQLLPHDSIRRDAPPASRRRQQAACLILRAPLDYTPGTRVVYSDLGFILLGSLLEMQCGQPLSTLFLDRVAQPLGLRHVAYRPLDQPSPLPAAPAAYAATEACPWRGRVLVGEVHDENAWAMGGIAGHAGLFATAEALGQFAQALLDTAAGKSDWLPAPLLQASWQCQPLPAGNTRALGWDTPTPGHSTAGEYFSSRSIGHLGFTGTSLWIDLERQVIVVLCTNRVHPSRQVTGIQRLRPAVHNLVMQALGVAPS